VWRRLIGLQLRRELLTDEPLTETSARHEYSAMPATPERWACAHEFVRIVCTALEGLNPQDRHILELRYFPDLSYREIADLLSVTTTNAGVRLARALGRLRELALQHVVEPDTSGFEGLPLAEWMSACNKNVHYFLIWTQSGRKPRHAPSKQT